jgi:hypothetical protein
MFSYFHFSYLFYSNFIATTLKLTVLFAWPPIFQRATDIEELNEIINDSLFMDGI